MNSEADNSMILFCYSKKKCIFAANVYFYQFLGSADKIFKFNF